jgi:hypothetical protein
VVKHKALEVERRGGREGERERGRTAALVISVSHNNMKFLLVSIDSEELRIAFCLLTTGHYPEKALREFR